VRHRVLSIDYNELEILLQEDPGLLKEENFHIGLSFVTAFICTFLLKMER
jgi:hypothetical protein